MLDSFIHGNLIERTRMVQYWYVASLVTPPLTPTSGSFIHFSVNF